MSLTITSPRIVSFEHPHVKRTESDAIHYRARDKERGIHPLTFIDSLPILSQRAKQWEVVSIGASLYNSYELYELTKKIERERIEWPRLIAEMPDYRRRRLLAKIEKLKQYSFHYYYHTLRIIKVGTILIPQPLLRKGVEGTIDAVSYSVVLKERVSTTDPELIMFPNRYSWRTAASRLFDISSYALYTIGALFSVAQSMEYLSETNSLCENVQNIALISYIGEIGFSVIKLFI